MRKTYVWIFFLSTLFICSCTPTEEKVTRNEAIRYAHRIETLVSSRSKDFLTTNISIRALVNRMDKIHSVPNKYFYSKQLSSELQKGELRDRLYETIGKEGTFTLLKIYEKDGFQRAVFRQHTSGINYYDFELTKIKNEIMISDFFIYMSGENYSKTLSDILYRYNENQKKNEEVATYQKINDAYSKGDFIKAKFLLDKLPSAYRNSKTMQLTNLHICREISDSIYAIAIDEFENNFKNEPNFFLPLIDVYYARNDYEKAMIAINKTDSMINKDPFLDYYRGLTLKMANKRSEAEKYFIQLTQNLPEFSKSYLELLVYYVDIDDKKRVKELYNKYKKFKNIDQVDLRKFEQQNPYVLL